MDPPADIKLASHSQKFLSSVAAILYCVAFKSTSSTGIGERNYKFLYLCHLLLFAGTIYWKQEFVLSVHLKRKIYIYFNKISNIYCKMPLLLLMINQLHNIQNKILI